MLLAQSYFSEVVREGEKEGVRKGSEGENMGSKVKVIMQHTRQALLIG